MDPAQTAALCTLSPLVSFAIALVALRRRPAAAAAVSLLGGTVALFGALRLLLAGPVAEPILYRWFVSGETEVLFGFLLDGPNLLMGTIVAGVALLVQIYSLGYMGHDPGKARYFALLSLFTWSMLSFVYAASLLQTFIFWELVGLASFLLIGFWYEKPEAVAAAKKAFVMTRIGDVGLFVGLILLLQASGTLEITELLTPANIAKLGPDKLTLITLLIFSGIVGKSAQFPLHTWLPDAMEGPTPVSALLHSATMVAAGVFLFARFHPLFMAAPTTQTVVLGVAAFTALLASTMAMVARDIKKVLAYSSISQLGFMLLGLAAGGLYAGLFHLTTHAFFKALLFLAAGAYIHHFGTNDLVAIGRAGGRKLRFTTAGLVVGAGALAGIPPLAGFFSKESILGVLHHSHRTPFLVMAYAAAFLTAYYSFRMVCLVLFPNPASRLTVEKVPEAPHGGHGHGASHGHGAHAEGDAPWVMRGPILLLTLASAAAGFFGARIAKILGAAEPAHPSIAELAPAVGIALFGVLLAYLEFGRRGAAQTGFLAHLRPLERLFERKWYLDDLNDKVFGGLVNLVSRLCHLAETRGLDDSADRLARGTQGLGGLTAQVQAGWLQVYIGTAVLLLAVFCYFLGAS
ncbi:MAG: NADH-quinone oxidoreductase subunit L [Deltaproteobacteria bacterium]|nr:NADH-quinone oxidoreductase subunit L [Deltaproteobacteria bacterium]